jgi:PAS domain S-box-containing protein
MSKRRELSFRAKMIFGGSLLVLFPLIIIGMTTFINTSHTLGSVSKAQLSQIAQGLAGMVDSTIERNLQILQNLAEDPQFIEAATTDNFDLVEERLMDFFSKAGIGYEGLGLFDRNGLIAAEGSDRSKIGIDISDRDYYRAVKSGQIGIGTPVFSKATGNPVFPFSVPIFSTGGEVVGAVNCVMKAEFLLSLINSVKVGSNGYAFIIGSNGIIIAHPDESKILSEYITDIEGVETLGHRMIQHETGTQEYVYLGERGIAGFAPVRTTGWEIGVTLKKKEIMSLAYDNRNIMMLLSAVFFVITVLCIVVFSRTISRPVQKTLTTLNQAIDQAAEAICIIGLDRKVRMVNPAMANIFDCPAEAMVGKDLFSDDIAETSGDEIWQQLEGDRIWSGHINGKKRDGGSFFLDVTVTPVKNEKGEVSCFLGIGRDITQELAMEAKNRQGQKMEAIGTLAGGIAHDFNNILSAIFGYTELTVQSLQEARSPLFFLPDIQKAAERARDLVQQIMAFSRQADQGNKALVPKDIVKEALKLLRASLPSTIDIEVDIRNDWLIHGDPTQVHQIVMNLCTNAGYAMREKGGTLRVTLADVSLDASSLAAKPGNHVMLEISDTGPGIPPEVMDRIFDPFFTTKPQGEGTGLGLSVIHGIVESMGGFVSVESTVGEGATFGVYFPAAKGSKALLQVQDRSGDEIPHGSERILLVDDEDILVETGSAMLERLGYQVTGFLSSPSALAAFRENPEAFDAVISDYTMPHMTGYELAEKLTEIRPDIPIIICSGYIERPRGASLREVGIMAFVKKPIKMAEIGRSLRSVLDGASDTFDV